MSTSRPKLMLDEQSFQGLLAAAFTIQEHNEQRRKKMAALEPACPQCGAAGVEDALLCQQCGDKPRQGEELQRKWASLWLLSQEQGLGPENFSSVHEEGLPQAPPAHFAIAETLPGRERAQELTEEIEIPISGSEEEEAEPVSVVAEKDWALTETALVADAPRPQDLTVDRTAAAVTVDEAAAAPGSLRDWQLRLRFHRADFYLVVAVAVATVAMVWVLSATPAPGAQRKPRLRAWERAMISMGLAEAPEPPPRNGNPNISVWVDPKTALYYCVGEELYGKARGGHLATQREAQLDQFEPAGRAACE